MRHTAVTAHSGCEGTPDNSMESVMAGLASGADAIEVDVRLDPTGALRLTHDMPDCFTDKVLLEDAFRAVIGTKAAINCDLKHYEALYPTIALADKCGLPRRQFIFSGSVDPRLLLDDPALSRRARIFLNTEEIFTHMTGRRPASRAEEMQYIDENLSAVAALVRNTGTEAVNAPHEHMPDGRIAALRAQGIELSLWTANTEEAMRRLLSMDLLSITTRLPCRAAAIRSEIEKSAGISPNCTEVGAQRLSFRYMDRAEFEAAAPALFDILADNMEKIAPTGCTREEDRAIWLRSMQELLQDDARRIALCFAGDETHIAGYFQFRASDGLLMMEEIEIAPEYQSSGAFRGLYSFVLPSLSGMETVEAYANKSNARSIGILHHLGLGIIGENKSGRSWHFRGPFSSLIRWHEGK